MKYYTNVTALNNKIYHRYIEDGVSKMEKVDFQPTIFTTTNSKTADNHGITNIDGEPLIPITYDSIKDMRNGLEQGRGVYGMKFYGTKNPVTQFISETYPDNIQFKANMLKEVRGFFIDIEVHSEEGFPHPHLAAAPITAFTIYDTKTKTFYVAGFHPDQKFTFDPTHPEIGNLNVVYKHFTNERDLLLLLITLFEKCKPDYLTGWNTSFFDTPYIVNRCKKILGNKFACKMSPYGSLFVKEKEVGKRINVSAKIYGIDDLDYLELYKKHTYVKQPSYSLDYIAHVVLGKKKLSYEEAGSLQNLYKTNFQKYIEYNIQDTNLVKCIDDKLKFLNVTFTIAYTAKINYIETLKTVPAWESMIYNELINENIMPPINSTQVKDGQYGGGYVMEPNTGKYKWVVSVDLASMYPHIYQQWNIGFESLIEPPHRAYNEVEGVTLRDIINGDVDTSGLPDNMCLAANGMIFKTDKPTVIHRIMRRLYSDRSDSKKVEKGYQKVVEKINAEIKARS